MSISSSIYVSHSLPALHAAMVASHAHLGDKVIAPGSPFKKFMTSPAAGHAQSKESRSPCAPSALQTVFPSIHRSALSDGFLKVRNSPPGL